jgi:hypothetical protein
MQSSKLRELTEIIVMTKGGLIMVGSTPAHMRDAFMSKGVVTILSRCVMDAIMEIFV